MPVPETCLVSDYVECTVTRDGRDLLVSLEGAVDFYTAGRVKKVLLDLLDHEPAGLTIDVSEAFVDSSGIGLLLQVAQRARLERRGFRLLCDERLKPVLVLHKLSGLLGFDEAVPAAELKPQRSSRPIAA
jgi:anti-anti-sigma factor